MNRSFYMFLFQLPIAERILAANDMEFLDHLWHDWAPGYQADEDLTLVKDSLRPKGRLTAAQPVGADYGADRGLPGPRRGSG